MVILTWLAHISKIAERVKVTTGFRRNFSRGSATSTFCLSVSGCWRCNSNGRSQNTLLFLHHEVNAPWKHALHLHIFWNLFQVELHTNVPQRCTFCYLLQILLNWRIIFQLSVKWTWTINNYVCGSLISLCWLNRTHFWNLLSELFSTLRPTEMLFLFINVLVSTFWALSKNKS